MNLRGIISISGKPGLYKVVGQSKNSIIVESIDSNKRIPAYAKDRISAIEDISIYTTEEDIPLKEVFTNIAKKENGENCISHKESLNKLENYLGEVLPNYDRERVYPSDIRKIFQWYNMLNGKGLLTIEEEKVEDKIEDAVIVEDEVAEEKEVKKPKKAPAKKKTTTAKAKKADKTEE